MTLTTEPHATSASPETDSTATDLKPQFPTAEAAYMALSELIIEDNVRENFDIADFPEMADSIREHGIGVAIKAYRYPDGTVHAFDGQLRTLIALAVGRTHGPVWIEPAPDLPAKDRTIARITEQITVNRHRIPLTPGDEARGIAQMLQLGVSVTKVSKSLAIRDLDAVRQAGRIGRSPTARSMLDENQLDLEQAVLLADFEAAGDTAAVEVLQREPRTSFLYRAHRIAQERREDRDYLTAALPYAAAGFAITMTEPETYGPDAAYIRAEDLLTTEDQPLTAELLHATPDSWVVYLTAADPVLIDRATGAVVAPESVDPNTRENPDAEPGEGLMHADTVEYRRPWSPQYFLPTQLLNASGYHLMPPPEPELAAVDADLPAVESEPINLDNSPEDVETAGPAPRTVQQVAEADREAELAAAQTRAQEQRAAKEAAAREAKRQQDRHDALVKDFAAATGARIDFVTKFLTRTTAPTSAQPFLLEAFGVHALELTDYQALHTGLKWIGVAGSRPGLAEATVKARPGRCTVMLLALVFAAFEARISRDAWAHKDPRTSFYLHYLAELGHHLTAVEQAAAGDIEPSTLTPGA